MSKPKKYGLGGDPSEATRLESQAASYAHILTQEFKLLNLKPKMKVLDAGCGSGAITRMMAKMVHPETVVGMDIDPVFIDEARKIAESKRVENIRFDIGNIDKMEYEDEAFDLAYCRLVLMHVNDPVNTVSEMKRVTKKDGYVVASDNEDDLMTGYPDAPAFWSLWKKYGERQARKGTNRHIGRELYSIFYRAGLSSISVHPMPIFATAVNPEAVKALISVPVNILESVRGRMIEEGDASGEDFDNMHKEIEILSEDRGAFCMGGSFLAIGKVT